jgi:hypothetical protein
VLLAKRPLEIENLVAGKPIEEWRLTEQPALVFNRAMELRLNVRSMHRAVSPSHGFPRRLPSRSRSMELHPTVTRNPHPV